MPSSKPGTYLLRVPVDKVTPGGAMLARAELVDADVPMASGVLVRMLAIGAGPLCEAVRHAVDLDSLH